MAEKPPAGGGTPYTPIANSIKSDFYNLVHAMGVGAPYYWSKLHSFRLLTNGLISK